MTQTLQLSISGMSCDHCVHAVRRALSKFPVTIHAVTIGRAHIEGDAEQFSQADIDAAIAAEGYVVVKWSTAPARVDEKALGA